MNRSTTSLADAGAISGQLAAGQPVERRFGHNGRLHIERPQPFLCLYRRPASRRDASTGDFVTTQASFLVAGDDETELDEVTELLDVVLTPLSGRFGNVLLLEIWSGEVEAADPETGMPPARITLHAKNRDAPFKALDELDRSLVAADWPGGLTPEVSVAYGPAVGPSDLPPVLRRKLRQDTRCVPIGLEISPFYREPENGRILPQLFSDVRKILGISMRRAFNTFIETHANYLPGHYHELGPQRLLENDLRVDAELVEIDDAVDLLLNVTPVNASLAWNRFRRTKFAETPEFHYRALHIDPAELKRRLFTVPVDTVEDPALHHIFATKREEIDRQISMLMDRGTENFLLESRQVYGAPDATLVATAKRILETLPPHTRDDRQSDFADAGEFADRAGMEIEHYRRLDASLSSRVEIRTDFPGLMVSHGNLIVGSSARVARHRIEATLQHEIGTHMLTYHNGGCQPLKLLQVGLADYEELQEGMAVLSEFLTGGLSRPRVRQLAGRVIAVDRLTNGDDFIAVFNLLHDEHGFSQRAAWSITLRVFRGGGFTKDVVYLRGLIQVLDYLENGGVLDSLLLGKIALQHTDITSELVWRQILEPPRLLPRYLDSGKAKARLREIESSHVSAIDLVLESLS